MNGRAAIGRTQAQALSIRLWTIWCRRGGGQGQRGRRGGRAAIAQRCNRGRLQIFFQALALAWGVRIKRTKGETNESQLWNVGSHPDALKKSKLVLIYLIIFLFT